MMKRASPLRIRKARKEDLAELTRIAHAAKRSWGYPEELIQLWSARYLSFREETLAERAVYAGVMGGRIAGVYALQISGASAELTDMWIEPAKMRQGIGRRLFAHAVRAARSLGAKTLRIEGDPNAEEFYLKMGAKRVGEAASIPAGRKIPLFALALGKSERSRRIPARRLKRTRGKKS